MSFIKEVVLVILGAFLGWGGVIIERLINKMGKLKIYYKFLNPGFEQIGGWGIMEQGKNKILTIPLRLEIQNTSNNNRVVRDVSVDLYNNRKYVGKLKQIEYSKWNWNDEKEREKVIYGDEGTYSFIVPAASIIKYNCFYSLIIDKDNAKKMKFTDIVLSYKDEDDRLIKGTIKSLTSNWDNIIIPIDDEWNTFKIDK